MRAKTVFRGILTVILAIIIAPFAVIITPFVLIHTLWKSFFDWLEHDEWTFQQAWYNNTQEYL